MPRRARMVVSCEHASRDRPADFDQTGIPLEIWDSHVAWDPGAREVAIALAKATAAPLFLGRWTRLFIDLNRSAASIEAVPIHAFGVDVPGNLALDSAARAIRIAEHHIPYWNAVKKAIEEPLAAGEVVLHVSIHSFTEVYEGVRRDLDLGILMDPSHPVEKILADRYLRAFKAAGYEGRINEPYDGRADALTASLRRELDRNSYAGIEIEMSHRLLDRLGPVEQVIVETGRALLDDAW